MFHLSGRLEMTTIYVIYDQLSYSKSIKNMNFFANLMSFLTNSEWPLILEVLVSTLYGLTIIVPILRRDDVNLEMK